VRTARRDDAGWNWSSISREDKRSDAVLETQARLADAAFRKRLTRRGLRAALVLTETPHQSELRRSPRARGASARTRARA
jgi:hypothetical protein